MMVRITGRRLRRLLLDLRELSHWFARCARSLGWRHFSRPPTICVRAWIPVVGTARETGGMLIGPLGAACPLEDGRDWAEVEPRTGRGVPPGPSHGTGGGWGSGAPPPRAPPPAMNFVAASGVAGLEGAGGAGARSPTRRTHALR